MSVDRTRLRFLMGGAGLAVSLAISRRGIAQDRPSRRITVYKNPT
jgi:hypothetical protein